MSITNSQYLLNDIKKYVEQFLNETRADPWKDTSRYMDEFERRYKSLILQTMISLSIDVNKFDWKTYAYYFIQEVRTIRDHSVLNNPDAPRNTNILGLSRIDLKHKVAINTYDDRLYLLYNLDRK